MKITKLDGFIYCETPYNKSFVDSARRLGGKWKSPAWVFPEDIEDEVMAILEDIYGYGSEKVDVIIVFKNDKHTCDIFRNSEVYIGGQIAFSRKSRDYGVSLGSGISILSGNFEKRGGSAKYPMISLPEDGLKILFRNFPKNKLHELDSIATYEIKSKEEKKSKYSDYSFEQLADMMAEIEKEMHKRMENMKSQVMTLAWKMYKEEKYDTFSECLKSAWAEVKKNA